MRPVLGLTENCGSPRFEMVVRRCSAALPVRSFVFEPGFNPALPPDPAKQQGCCKNLISSCLKGHGFTACGKTHFREVLRQGTTLVVPPTAFECGASAPEENSGPSTECRFVITRPPWRPRDLLFRPSRTRKSCGRPYPPADKSRAWLNVQPTFPSGSSNAKPPHLLPIFVTFAAQSEPPQPPPSGSTMKSAFASLYQQPLHPEVGPPFP